jgi:iron complex transport system substrate-binding protein
MAVTAAAGAGCGSNDGGDAGSVPPELTPTSTTVAAAVAEPGADATPVEPVAPTTEPTDTNDPTAPEEPIAERIIVSDQAVLDAALALDLPVVGIPGFADRESIPAYLAERAQGVEVLAERSQVNLESLAAARPDLLLFSSKLVDESGARSQLAEIAPLVELDASTAEPWRDVLREVAAAAGVPMRAEQRIAEVEAAIAEARDAIGADGLATEVSVVRCFGESCRYLPGGTSFSGQVLDELGVARPVEQASDPEGRAFVEVSPERVDLLDGDLIVLFGTDAQDSLTRLQTNPLWEQLDAVQAGEVHEVDAAAWFAGSVLAVEAIITDMVRLLQ